MNRAVLRVAAVVEAETVTGPAKNLIEFATTARRPELDLPVVELSVVTFVRCADSNQPLQNRNSFLRALDAAGILAHVVRERFRFDPASLRGLLAAVQHYAPDVIQTHSVKSHFLARLAGLNKRFPWIGFHHGYTATDLKMQLYNQLDRWSLPGARRIVTVCKPFATQMIARGVEPDKIKVFHNSVRLPSPTGSEDIGELRRSFRLGENDSVVLAVGRFSKEKGHADLIAAIAEMRRVSQRSFKVVLVGDGPERTNLEQQIRALGLQDFFIFAGQVSTVSPFYTLASVMALPSHSEGSPNVVLEAMAHGIPVVATKVGGVPEILDNGETGLLVPPRDAVAMARGIETLLSDRLLAGRLAMQARARVEQFTPEAYRKAMLRLYLEVLAETSRERFR
ncbi:MAG: glycosyltransferase [Acidobacteriaceae bacterium]|nr:glycosyltransferase [Acidobacteriaceae bacterium]